MDKMEAIEHVDKWMASYALDPDTTTVTLTEFEAKEAIEQAFDDAEFLRVCVENQWRIGTYGPNDKTTYAVCDTDDYDAKRITEFYPTYQEAIRAAIAAKGAA